MMPAPLRRRLRPAPASTAQGTPACSGTRTETYQPSSPDGVYSQSNIDVYGTKVKYIDVVFHPVCAPPAECVVPLSETVTYKMDLEGCMIVGDMCIPFPGEMHKTFTDGRFIDLGNNKGAMFIPRSSEPLNPINELLKIQWCPDQNYFLVKLAGQLLEPLRHQATVFSAVSPLADASSPAHFLGSVCNPALRGACGSGTRFSTLTCVRHCYNFDIGPPTCRPKNPVEGEACCPDQTCAGGLECRRTEGGDFLTTCKQPK